MHSLHTPRQRERLNSSVLFLKADDARDVSGIWAFNFMPSSYLHASWRNELLPIDSKDALWKSARAQRFISKHILNVLGLEQMFLLDPYRPFWPFVLVPYADFIRFIWGIALVFISRSVRAALSSQHIRDWKNCIGDEGYEFITQHIPLIYQDEYELQRRIVAPFISGNLVFIFGICITKFYLDGASQADEGLWSRIRLKLPRSLIRQAEEVHYAYDVPEMPDWKTVRIVYERLMRYRYALPKDIKVDML
jgi:hypothetical protein